MTVIMGGIGMAVLGAALIVLILRMLLAQAVARDVEATRMRAGAGRGALGQWRVDGSL
ncbi:hypothetical protein [Actinomadura rugatobispora]|uniref:Uncharacterized protein n=1 Tax=Actinomadura rugatobispora TaxID=1994 RepID=A0ABW1AH36_9ACTN